MRKQPSTELEICDVKRQTLQKDVCNGASGVVAFPHLEDHAND